MILLHEVSKVAKLLETESWMVVAQEAGGGEMGSRSVATELQFCKMKKF